MVAGDVAGCEAWRESSAYARLVCCAVRAASASASMGELRAREKSGGTCPEREDCSYVTAGDGCSVGARAPSPSENVLYSASLGCPLAGIDTDGRFAVPAGCAVEDSVGGSRGDRGS
jgi:hypothetical protein